MSEAKANQEAIELARQIEVDNGMAGTSENY